MYQIRQVVEVGPRLKPIKHDELIGQVSDIEVARSTLRELSDKRKNGARYYIQYPHTPRREVPAPPDRRRAIRGEAVRESHRRNWASDGRAA